MCAAVLDYQPEKGDAQQAILFLYGEFLPTIPIPDKGFIRGVLKTEEGEFNAIAYAGGIKNLLSRKGLKEQHLYVTYPRMKRNPDGNWTISEVLIHHYNDALIARNGWWQVRGTVTATSPTNFMVAIAPETKHPKTGKDRAGKYLKPFQLGLCGGIGKNLFAFVQGHGYVEEGKLICTDAKILIEESPHKPNVIHFRFKKKTEPKKGAGKKPFPSSTTKTPRPKVNPPQKKKPALMKGVRVC
jgi:hypothetical protein